MALCTMCIHAVSYYSFSFSQPTCLFFTTSCSPSLSCLSEPPKHTCVWPFLSFPICGFFPMPTSQPSRFPLHRFTHSLSADIVCTCASCMLHACIAIAFGEQNRQWTGSWNDILAFVLFLGMPWHKTDKRIWRKPHRRHGGAVTATGNVRYRRRRKWALRRRGGARRRRRRRQRGASSTIMEPRALPPAAYVTTNDFASRTDIFLNTPALHRR